MLRKESILVAEPVKSTESELVRLLKTRTEAEIFHAKKPTEALEFIKKNKSLKLLFADLFAPEQSGLQLIQEAIGANPAIVPIAIIPPGDRSYIVESMQAGASFYILTPYHEQEILEVIPNALEHQSLVSLSLQRTASLRKSDGFCGIIGESKPMKKLFQIINRVAANSHGNVLLRGESGTGKELVAKAIHDLTPERNRNNFVPLNCAAIPEELLESELFGYEKGAFTGANRAKKGRLKHADKGTLFLDEIGDMKPNLQAKLLRVLQEQTFEPIGSVNSVEIDLRVIAATNRDLEQEVEAGNFREDLYYRLSVVPMTLPPLRERPEDIPPLVHKFLLMYNRGRKNAPLGFSEQSIKRLKAHDWPGNVRELQNLVQRMCILHSGNTVDAGDLPQKFQYREAPEDSAKGPAPESNPQESLDFHAMTIKYENQLILKALHTANGNKKEAARLLNMKRTTLLEKIKKRRLDQSEIN